MATNLRPYLVALLASTYVLAWWRFGARAPEGAAAEPPALGSLAVEGPPRIAAWFHDLPPALRPDVEVPVGWHIADPTAASARVTTREAPAPMRVSPARARRIRTRSS